jgi:hypothetical protein
MINTLSYEQAVNKCPAIAASAPSSKVSKHYAFIPTSEILQKALASDWLVHNVKKGRGSLGAHQVSLVHKSQVTESTTEGFPQVLIMNSHDLTKRFSLNVGFFRLVCSNGLIAPTGLCSYIAPTLHRQAKGQEESLFDSLMPGLENAFNQYSTITSKITEMKSRNLSDEERMYLARYAYYIRFRYRMSQPKKFDASEILKPRREIDNTKTLWHTFNVIQENITLGGPRIGKGITQFQDDTRFNQEFWTGVDKALSFQEEDLNKELKQLFPKKNRSRKS